MMRICWGLVGVLMITAPAHAEDVLAALRAAPTAEAVAAVLPDHAVMVQTEEDEGGIHDVVVATGPDGRPAVRVHPDDGGGVWAVEILTPAIPGPGGRRVGTPYREIGGVGAFDCVAGMEGESGAVLCQLPDAPDVTYIFEPEWDGPDGVMPPAEVLVVSPLARLFVFNE